MRLSPQGLKHVYLASKPEYRIGSRRSSCSGIQGRAWSDMYLHAFESCAGCGTNRLLDSIMG